MISENCILDNGITGQPKSEVFRNRTYFYLSPILKAHGEYFVKRLLEDTHRLAFGIFDTALAGSPLIEESNKRPIFLLLSSTLKPTRLEAFLSFIRTEPYYITDYVFDTFNIPYPTQRMLVLDVPQEFYNAYDNFKLGNYSQMYTPEQIHTWFRKGEVAENLIKILTKDSTYKSVFQEKLIERFNVEVTTNQINELDFPYTLDKSAEIFGYKYLL